MVASITEWILSLNGALALTIVFAFTALEASAFVGFLFPGEIAVLLGGVLAFEGRVPLEAVIGVAIAGAVIGDSIGYAVGRRWGHQMLGTVGSRIPFVRHRIDEHLDSAKAFVKRRGGAAVFLGRFTAALRVMVPGLAGTAEMRTESSSSTTWRGASSGQPASSCSATSLGPPGAGSPPTRGGSASVCWSRSLPASCSRG